MTTVTFHLANFYQFLNGSHVVISPTLLTHRRHLNHFNRSIKRHARTLWWTYRRRISQGMELGFEEAALKVSSEIDGRALV